MMKSVVDGKCDFLNFYKYPSDMPVAGKYDIPVFKGIKLKHPEKYSLIAFDESHLIPKSERKKYIVHFFIYDYKFERVWTYLNKNTEYLKQFAAVIQPDFSLYTDMPRAMQIWNAWRANFMAWWWQNEGLKVIPNSYWTDQESFDFCFGSMPKNSCICVSSKGSYTDDRKFNKSQANKESIALQNSNFRQGLETMIATLRPSQILWLGPKIDWVNDLMEYYNVEVLHLSHRKLYQERLDKMNKKDS